MRSLRVPILFALLTACGAAAQALPVKPPCAGAPEFRQLDFWLGDWDVTTPAGHSAGRSRIELILGSCVIFENWISQGYEGKSFNLYNAQSRKWEQVWVDSAGAIRKFTGEFRDGAMRYVADIIGPDGNPRLVRMVLTKQSADRVRQLSEFSTDGGATWQPRYDLIYTRRK